MTRPRTSGGRFYLRPPSEVVKHESYKAFYSMVTQAVLWELERGRNFAPGGMSMSKVLILLLVLTLAACDLASYDPMAALQQPANPTATQTAPATATEPAPMTCTVTAEALHVRSGAGVSYAVTGYLYAGDIVTIQTQRGAWLDIGAGWVHSKYCEKVKP